MVIYVVKVGGNLYLTSNMYGLYQATTNDILHAKWFKEYKDAEKQAKKALRATIEEYRLTRDGAEEDEIDMLKASVKELQRQKAELLELNDSYKELLKGYQKNV